jgi:hypothetical protein
MPQYLMTKGTLQPAAAFVEQLELTGREVIERIAIATNEV